MKKSKETVEIDDEGSRVEEEDQHDPEEAEDPRPTEPHLLTSEIGPLTRKGITNDEVKFLQELLWEATCEAFPEREYEGVEPLISRFIDYAARTADCPLAYFLGSGLAMLAGLAPPSLHGPNLPGCNEPCCWYSILIGGAGKGHKSQALKRAHHLLDEAVKGTAIPGMGSWEALVDRMHSQGGTGLLCIQELGGFLAQAKAGAGSRILPELTGAYDGAPIDATTRSKGVRKIQDPRLSLVGCINPGYIASLTDPTDWSGGLLSRFFICRSADIRPDPEPTHAEVRQNRVLANGIGDELKRLKGAAVGTCAGFTDEGALLWRRFLREVKNVGEERTSNQEAVAAAHARTTTIAFRSILIFAFDIGIARTKEEWLIDVPLVRAGIYLAKLHRREAVDLAAMVTFDEFMRKRNAMELYLREEEGWVPISELARPTGLGMSIFDIDKLVLHMQTEKSIRSKTVKGERCYRLVDPEGSTKGTKPLTDGL